MSWLIKSGIQLPSSQTDILEIWEKKGYTIIHIAAVGEWIGMAAITDTLRKDAKLIIQHLKQNGLKVHLLTGDRKAP